MKLFGQNKKPTPFTKVLVYYLSRIDENGKPKATPLGVMPRFSDELEAAVRDKADPAPGSLIDININDVSIVALWNGAGVEAVSFLSVDEAHAFPGFQEISADDLAALEGAGLLEHFPRDRLTH